MKLIPLGLNARKHRGYFAKVDDEDYEELMKYSWQVSYSSKVKSFYAYRSKKIKGRVFKTAMHRQVTGAPKGKDVDHINHDTLDNRRSNLRLCSRGENLGNRRKLKRLTSKYKGVWWKKEGNIWEAGIRFNGTVTRLGYFNDEEEAARAYDAVAPEYFGEFAHLNFPKD